MLSAESVYPVPWQCLSFPLFRCLLTPGKTPAVADEPDNHVLILAIRPPFSYVIPRFDVLKVEVRQIKIKFAGEGGDEEIQRAAELSAIHRWCAHIAG